MCTSIIKKSIIFNLIVISVLIFATGQTYATTKHLIFGGGATGGVFYIVASAMATLAQKYIPNVKATSEISAGSIENCKRLARGEQTFALVSAETGYHAFKKLREFKDSKDSLEDLRLVMYGYDTTLHVFVNDDSPIRSIPDFRGKKIGLAIGPVATVWWPFIRDAYNIKDKDYSAVVLGAAELMSALRDRHVDAVVFWGGAPTVSITDLALTRRIRFIEVKDKEADIITQDRPYFFKGILPANTYSRQPTDVETLLTSITLSTIESVDPELVYKLIDVILTHNDELKLMHPLAVEFNKKNAVGLEVYPYHPGAKKYYKEHGMMK